MGVVGDFLFGDSEQPGLMGTGQYKAQPWNINQQAFMNPVGDQSQNWNSGMQNMLGATTGSAAQMGQTQLGPAQTFSGAKVGPTAQAGGANLGPTATFGGAQLNAGQYNQTFGQQQALANQMLGQARGEGPSVAQVQAQQQAQANTQAQMAMLGSQRGSSNPALAQQQALNAGAAAQQQAAQQAVLGRTQEVLGAQANAGNLLGQMNQQATSFAGANAQLQQQAQLQSMAAINAQNQAQAQLMQQNQQFNVGALNAQQLAQAQLYQQAGLANQADINQFMMTQGQMNQQANMANLQAQMSQNQLNAQQYNQYMNMLQQQNLAQYQGQMGYEQLGVQQQNQINAINAGAYQNAAQARSSGMGMAVGAIGGLAMMSDKTAKTNIKDASKELDNILTILSRL